MSLLETLTPPQRDMLISLPYRVGYLVSQCDQSGGDEAQKTELQVLSNIIHGFAAETFSGSELVYTIMVQSVKRREEWPEWAKNMVSVSEDCRQSVYLIRQAGNEKEVSAFVHNLIEIAEAVAMAFSEHEEASFLTRILQYIHYGVSQFQSSRYSGARLSLKEFLSISPQERRVLGLLEKSLGVGYG